MLKKIQPTLILALCAAAPVVASGATRSVEEAKILAAEFFQSGAVHRLADKDAFTLAHTASDGSLNPVCYVLNATDGKGFIIVSADEDAMPVIGYSDTNTWNMFSVPDAAAEMLTSPVAASSGSRLRVAGTSEMQSKLLSTPQWSQEAPFNNYIPNHRLTGCVGVALAEILKYHSYPATRPASLVGEGQSANYAWNAMRDDNYRSGYTQEEADAVAAVVADAAIAIGTDFGQSSSSAFEVKVPYALTAMLGYDAGVSYKKRSEIDRDTWDAIIVNEINEDRPVLYSGQDVSAGHAFVCDGYELRDVPFFHINWGWGGSANGYFASNALNPVVSRSHSYNNLQTIVYNIKPATDNVVWSPIHVTSDERQVGLTIDTDDISAVSSFTVRAGALKNISNTDFSGKLAVALFGADGTMKGLLNDGRNFGLVALQINNYVDFTCKVPSGMSVADGDVVRLVTRAADADQWLPVAGDLLAPGEMLAKGGVMPYFLINLPDDNEFVSVSAPDNKVIKGRDFSFTVTPGAADKVITVKANGFILTADANNGYKMTNILEDQNINIIVQDAADVLSKSTLWLEAGNLHNLLGENETATVTDLTLFGTMNVDDFTFIRERMKLSRLDISQVTIVASGSSPANAIPTKAFLGCRSLKQIILPNNLTTFKNGCLAQTGLTSIEIPASVGTYEYNVFVACSALREVTVRRSTAAWVNWCVFSGVPQNKLIVPTGATASYRAKEYWRDFKEIVEEDPVTPDTYRVTVQEVRGLNITPLTEGSDFAPGSQFSFTIEGDNSFGDTTMEVYANNTRLYPDAAGNYVFQVRCNTLVHVAFKSPEPTTPDNTWKLTGALGGVGLVTDVVNVPVGKSFNVRANAIWIPSGVDCNKFYAMVLTNKDGAIKEFISPVYTNTPMTTGNQALNISCKVVESQIREGNLLRLATSYNKKVWNLVEADADTITDRLSALGNAVLYHSVDMPQTLAGATIEGAATQVVRGMPFNLRVTPVSPTQRVTLAVNGVNKAVNAAVANLSIPSVTEDLEISIQINDADASDYVVISVREGELAAKIAECPERLKLIGAIMVNEFDAFRNHAGTIIDLDLADLTIKGAATNRNSIPENAFAPKTAGGASALRSIILPQNLERIDQYAFARCLSLTEISIPKPVTFIGSGAFGQCVALKKITVLNETPPMLGNMTPFPPNPSSVTLIVPKGSENAYRNASYWNTLTLYQDPQEYYWIKYDPTRIIPMGNPGDLNRIGITVGSRVGKEVYFFLPNIQNASYTRNPRDNYRPGQPFKLYDNGFDIIDDMIKASNPPYPNQVSPYDDVIQNYSKDGGKICIKLLPSYPNHRFYKPQNHELKLVFYYPVTFQNLEGSGNATGQFVNLVSGQEWKGCPMTYFTYTDKTKKDVYMEGKDLKFRLRNTSPNVTYSVNIKQSIMTKSGANREFEEKEFDLTPDQDGVYTIPELPGETWVRISGTLHLEEGQPVPAEDLSAAPKEDVEEFTELTVTGSMDEEDFDAIRDKFDALETLDLSQIDNDVIPEGAFEGMENLRNVIISESVTEIGAGAFNGCGNLETLTLSGVNAIGEGAFEGCTSLTSILIPSAGTSGSETPEGKPAKAPAEGAITAESFRGINPNCLIYMGSTDIPDAEHLNIILNIDGTRVAASDIVLDGAHSFSAPASFNLGDHRISFTIDIPGSLGCDVDGGWKGIMLPFTPTKMEYGVEFANREGSGITVVSFDSEDAETMTAQNGMKANHPYLANVSAPFVSVPVTFYAEANPEAEEGQYDVPFSPVPEETVAVGKNFSLFGSYDGQTVLGTCLALNEDASAFFVPAEEDSVAVRPFDAYLRANDGVALNEFTVGGHSYWVCDPMAAGVSGSKLYRSGLIEIASPTKGATIRFTVDGTQPDAGNGQVYTNPFALTTDTVKVTAIAEYKGFRSEVVELEYMLKRTDLDFELAHNWTWISHNMENAVAVADFAGEGISRIVSPTQEAISDPKLGLVGSLRELTPLAGYKVCVSADSWNGNISGIAYDPAVPVTLHRGWNWIGSPVDDASLLISDLFAALEAEEGDMIVGLEGFQQVDAEGNWSGSLNSLVPGMGYMYYSASEKELTYTLAPVSDVKKPAKAEIAGSWVVDIHRYPSVMPVTATLIGAAGEEADAADYTVAAFCGDECRGIGVVVDGAVMINVHGLSGDMISFRFITPEGEEMISETSMCFGDAPVGTIAEPAVISLIGTTALDSVNGGAFAVIGGEGSISLAGAADGITSVEVYDLSGVRIAATKGTTVSGLNAGYCIVVVRTADNVTYHKILVK